MESWTRGGVTHLQRSLTLLQGSNYAYTSMIQAYPLKWPWLKVRKLLEISWLLRLTVVSVKRCIIPEDKILPGENERKFRFLLWNSHIRGEGTEEPAVILPVRRSGKVSLIIRMGNGIMEWKACCGQKVIINSNKIDFLNNICMLAFRVYSGVHNRWSNVCVGLCM